MRLLAKTPKEEATKNKSPSKEKDLDASFERNDLKRKLDENNSEDSSAKKSKFSYDIEFVGLKKTKKKPLNLEKLWEIKKEKIAHLRNQNNIHVNGTDMPDPASSFEQLVSDYKLPPFFLENLKKMEILKPTPVQMQAITAVLHNRNIMVCAPTGSGKTLAFSIPILHQLGSHQESGFRAVVLAPTRELAQQIHDEMVQVSVGSSIQVKFLTQSKTSDDRNEWMSADIVITTPKKLVYAMKTYKKEISFKSVQWLIVDESDKLFEDGERGFREQLAVIYKKCQSKSIRTLLFSATFSQEVEEWCHNNLDDLLQVYVGAINSAAKTIDQKLVYVGEESGKLMALKNIFTEGFAAPVLIFVQSKERSEELHHELSSDGLSVEVIHSEKSLRQRDAIVRDFRSGKILMLICTDVMARGIDFKEVNLVINYDFPMTSVAYIHRIGRTGRAGKSGKAITFFTSKDVSYLRKVANLMQQSGCEVPEYMLKIPKLSRKDTKKISKKPPHRKPISVGVPKSEKIKKLKRRIKKKKPKKLNKTSSLSSKTT